MSSPDRIRTGVTALRGRRPRPLDDGAKMVAGGSASPARYTIPPPGEWSQFKASPQLGASEISGLRDQESGRRHQVGVARRLGAVGEHRRVLEADPDVLTVRDRGAE